MAVNVSTMFIPVHDPALGFHRTQGSLQGAASGAQVLQEPASQPWGAGDCAVRDRSGKLVRIGQA